MSELGKVEERSGIDMNPHLLPCKAETELGFRHITVGTTGIHACVERRSIKKWARDQKLGR